MVELPVLCGKREETKMVNNRICPWDFGGEGERGFKKYREYVERGVNKELDNP